WAGIYGEAVLAPSEGAKHPGCDNQALNLAGAFVDFGNPRVTIHPLDRIFAAVPVSAMNLDGFVSHARGHFRSKKLGDGSLHGKSAARILFPRRPANQESR